jgi:hypothetical protein
MTVPPFGKESLGSRDMTTKKFTLLWKQNVVVLDPMRYVTKDRGVF